MAHQKATKYARLLKRGDKFYQPDTYPRDIWIVRHVVRMNDGGMIKVFVQNRTHGFVLSYNERVNLHHG